MRSTYAWGRNKRVLTMTSELKPRDQEWRKIGRAHHFYWNPVEKRIQQVAVGRGTITISGVKPHDDGTLTMTKLSGNLPAKAKRVTTMKVTDDGITIKLTEVTNWRGEAQEDREFHVKRVATK